MMKLIISNQLEMKFQKLPDRFKLITVNMVVTLLITLPTKQYANAGNVDQLTQQYYMETYLPNSIKKVSPSVPKTDETNIFKDYSVELTKKDDKWAFSDKDSYVEKWDYYLLSYTYTG